MPYEEANRGKVEARVGHVARIFNDVENVVDEEHVERGEIALGKGAGLADAAERRDRGVERLGACKVDISKRISKYSICNNNDK